MIFYNSEVLGGVSFALKLANEIGYPMIAKPDIGVGGCGCQKINDEEELRAFFQTPKQNYLLEEFIEGELISFDGLADRDRVSVKLRSDDHDERLIEARMDALLEGLNRDGRHRARVLENVGQIERSAFHTIMIAVRTQ